uniref:Trafficking protein particle complex subunit n=1 Tax=Compsopogon caeruleus TaxID=31354 RepID=A0A7S1XF07_9RHOD|mmetsp:Transcript_1904/g.3438  ORF Transcript_1904/g.3438 Transcript_1904/m.3438 type:complete len:187 (+) Transcript_1904:77-637(+)
MSKQSLQKIGEAAFARCERVSAELLSLTYGSMVRQLLHDYESVDEVNVQLDKMGYNIGIRLVDDFLSKSRVYHCAGFAETAETISKVGFKMYLGVNAVATNWSEDKKSFGLVFDENPLTEFTELPEAYEGLWYSNILCGVIRGSLQNVQMVCECKFVRCTLRGDEANEIRVTLKEILQEKPPADED